MHLDTTPKGTPRIDYTPPPFPLIATRGELIVPRLDVRRGGYVVPPPEREHRTRDPRQAVYRIAPPPGDLRAVRDCVERGVRRHRLRVHHGGVTGRYKVMVLDRPGGRVIHERPWANNLILDQGLNQEATTRWSQLFLRCVVGTGTTPTFRDSTGIAQITTAGTAVSADAPFFEAGDVGRLLKLDSGGEAYITVFTDTQNVTVGTTLGATGPQDACVWYVNQTGLATETKRTNTYLTGAGNCGTTTVGSVRTMRRTYDFSAEGAPINYTELGWANAAGAGNNLFSRTLISGGSVSLLTGQALRVVYDLSITLSPTTPVAGTSTVTGWPVAPAATQDGDYQLGTLSGPTFSNIDTSGGAGDDGGCCLEPSSSDPTSNDMETRTGTVMPTWQGSYTSGASIQSADCATLGAYVNGTYTRTKSGTYTVAQSNSTGIRGVHLHRGGNTGIVFIWDEAQTKDNLHTLQFIFTISWSRTLTNP